MDYELGLNGDVQIINGSALRTKQFFSTLDYFTYQYIEKEQMRIVFVASIPVEGEYSNMITIR